MLITQNLKIPAIDISKYDLVWYDSIDEVLKTNYALLVGNNGYNQLISDKKYIMFFDSYQKREILYSGLVGKLYGRDVYSDVFINNPSIISEEGICAVLMPIPIPSGE